MAPARALSSATPCLPRRSGREAGPPHVGVADGTTPIAATPADVGAAQKQLKVLQWAIPALTGAIIVVSAKAGEQQRATNVAAGILHRITG